MPPFQNFNNFNFFVLFIDLIYLSTIFTILGDFKQEGDDKANAYFLIFDAMMLGYIWKLKKPGTKLATR